MNSPVAFIEGQSATIYLTSTFHLTSSPLSEVGDWIRDGGGATQMDERLGRLRSEGIEDQVFFVWDQDLLRREGTVPLTHLPDHPYSHTFASDFESLFPEWMIADALKLYAPEAPYPDAETIRQACRVRSSDRSFFERLEACARQYAADQDADYSIYPVPNKVDLAKCLAEVANRTWFQPESIRRLITDLEHFFGLASVESLLDENSDQLGHFTINLQLISDDDLRGRMAVFAIPDIWIIDLDQRTETRLEGVQGSGEPCWSPDGNRLAFPAQAPLRPGVSSVGIHDMTTHDTEYRMHLGRKVCWDGEGQVLGQSDAGWQVQSLNLEDSRRRVLPLPDGSILASADRGNARVLIGVQGHPDGRFSKVFRMNDGTIFWQGAPSGMVLSQYEAGSFSPDGAMLAWPMEERQNSGTSSLWITHIAGSQSGSHTRLTNPEGQVMMSCWSPDGLHIAFVWSRWGGDPARMWRYNTRTSELAPLMEGDFGSNPVRAIGCHSWNQ